MVEWGATVGAWYVAFSRQNQTGAGIEAVQAHVPMDLLHRFDGEVHRRLALRLRQLAHVLFWDRKAYDGLGNSYLGGCSYSSFFLDAAK